MQDKMAMAKIISFILITFLFAFFLFMGFIPMPFGNNLHSSKSTDNNIVENKKTEQRKESDRANPLPIVDNAKEEKPLSGAELKKGILGIWQLTEISSQGRTVKIDTTQNLAPDQIVIYKFSDSRIDVSWGGSKTVLTYKWLSDNSIESIQPKTKPGESDYKELATLRIENGKLYMSSTNSSKSKSSGMFVRYTGNPDVVTQ